MTLLIKNGLNHDNDDVPVSVIHSFIARGSFLKGGCLTAFLLKEEGGSFFSSWVGFPVEFSFIVRK